MKSYLRFLSRNKLYTAIEVVGLSLALAFVIPLINVIADKYERSHAHEKYEDIYAVGYMGNLYTEVNFSDYLKESIPEIEMATSAMLGTRSIVDKDFFYFFPFEFVEGDESFLDSRDNIAVSEKFAAMIADGSAMGKAVKIEDRYYTVAAVFKNSRNDILKECEILQNIAPFKELRENGGISSGVTFISIRKGHDRKEIESRILEAADTFNAGDETYMKYKEAGVFRGLVRYDELPTCMVNYGQFMKYQHGPMALVAALLLLIFITAILNYINLNVALSTTRAKENATRKLVGATRRHLIISNLYESLAFTTACFVLGYLLSGYTGQFIKGLLAMTEFTDFSVEPIWNIRTITVSVTIIIITALAAGLAPSLMASRFSPLDITKGDFRLHSKRRLSKFFISFQTILSVVLLSVVLMADKCHRDAMKVDFNCDIEDVVYMRVTPENAAIMLSKAAEYPEILSCGRASQVPAQGLSGAILIPDTPQFLFSHIECDRSGFETLGFEILQQNGNDFNGLWLTPYTQSFIENDPRLLDHLYKSTGTDHIAGIVNDFPGVAPLEGGGHYLTIASVKEEPIRTSVVFKIAGDHKKGRELVQTLFNDAQTNMIAPDGDITGMEKARYVLDILEETTAPTRLIIKMIGIVMVLVVIMSMMGLIGMSMHFMNERKNEIAVRRIFGATENGEMMRNLRFYLIMTGIASVLGICVAEFVRQFFIVLGSVPQNVWWIYVVSVALSFAISIASVLWQTLRAARTNPAEALKKE
ncbi:MAG: FtsX-like permease family protein [Bacteroidales bacterium]|nr:FtsX-like permease family protein [Bacteroidales bacterium]